MKSKDPIPKTANTHFLLSDLLRGMTEIERHGGVWKLKDLPNHVVTDLNSATDNLQEATVSGLRSLGSLLFWADTIDEPARQDYTRDSAFLIQLLADAVEVSRQASGDLEFIRHRCKRNADGTWFTPENLYAGEQS